MKRLILFILIITCNANIAFAQEKTNQNTENINSEKTDSITNNFSSEFKSIVDYNKENNSKNGFSAHKSNYMLPISRSNYDEDGARDQNEIKFQISVKQRLLKFYGWALFFGYTQKSFWQAYDIDRSSPFRDNNFNPEIFVRTKMWDGWRFDSGLEHESNGRDLPESKSWNRLYLTPYFENKYFIFAFKMWYRIPKEEKESPTDPRGDDNPDIHKFYGYASLNIQLKFSKFRISSTFRYNPLHNKGAAQVDLTYPMYTNSSFWYLQYWDGYGECLLDYNLHQRRIGFGIMFTQ